MYKVDVLYSKVGQYFNISLISGNLGHAIMISLTFSVILHKQYITKYC